MSLMDQIKPGALYLPDVGLTGSDERAAAAAVREYDPECRLGQRKDTGEWIIYMTNPVTGEPFPVLGFGRRIPNPEEIKRKMYETDVRRHGGKIFEAINRRNEMRQKESRRQSSEASGAMAEAMVSGFEKQGHNPFPKVFIPKGVRSV